MDKSLIVSDEVRTLVPACLKAISSKVIDLFGDMYVFLKTNCGSTLLFKVIQYFKPSEDAKDIILGIVGSYGAWFDFGGVFFPSSYKIGAIWLTTFRRCVGCSTREQCTACIWAAMNSIAACFPNLFPAKVVWSSANYWVRLAFKKSKVVKLIQRKEELRKILSHGGIYIQF